ncbi:MAG TPA: RNA methyltransferase, partial [Caulobacteraceae bacterium]
MRGPRRDHQRPSLAKPELREVDILRVGAQGDGVAEGPVYVPFTLPGERVRAKVQAGRGELVEVLSPSPERQTPPCPHFLACGGCALQHWAELGYLGFKVEMIQEALSRERLETEILSPMASPLGSRRRLALHARPGGPEGARLGYKARGSWSLVEIVVCPIADPRLVESFPALRRLAAAFLEHPRSAPTLHVTWTDAGIDVDVSGVERRTGGLSADAQLRAAEAAQAAGFARVTLAGETLYQSRRPEVRIGRAQVAL